MVRQGEEHAAADLLIKERIEAVNQGKLFFKDVLIILDIVVSLSDLSFMVQLLKLRVFLAFCSKTISLICHIKCNTVDLRLIFEKSISKNGV